EPAGHIILACTGGPLEQERLPAIRCPEFNAAVLATVEECRHEHLARDGILILRLGKRECQRRGRIFRIDQQPGVEVTSRASEPRPQRTHEDDANGHGNTNKKLLEKGHDDYMERGGTGGGSAL